MPEIELSPACVSPILAPRCREPRSPADQIGLIVLANPRRVFEGVLGWDYYRFVAVGDGFICIHEVSPPFRRFTFRVSRASGSPKAHNLQLSTAHCLATTQGIPDLIFFRSRCCCCWYFCRVVVVVIVVVAHFSDSDPSRLKRHPHTYTESAPLVFVEKYEGFISIPW